MLTREDANSESALLSEWLVDDRAEVRKGQVVCVVETSKASVEIESPGDGTIVLLAAAGLDVELGSSIALVAESADEVAAAEARLAATAPEAAGDEGPRNVTKKAAQRAAELGVDVSLISKSGFITAEDVEAFAASAAASAGGEEAGEADVVFAGLDTTNVTLPAIFSIAETDGALDEAFLAELRADPVAFAALPAEKRLDAYRANGARIGEGVVLGEGAVVVAPRIVLEDRVELGDRATVECDEVFAAGELAKLGTAFRLTCRRAFVGAGTWSGENIRVGGGGHRDPWATFVIGELGFIGDEVFVNVGRPVLIGAEVFVTMRSVLLTHNVGHSVLEGFENRFVGVVVEDRAQIGVGSVVYAGCRIGREAIVVSNSYVVNDVHEGALAAGVPARPIGSASRALARPRQVELARKMVDDLRELLSLRGVETGPLSADGAHGFELTGAEGPGPVAFLETVGPGTAVPEGEGETVVLTLEATGDAPAGCAVLDLLGRRVSGEGGVLLDSVRELCRKRGIRLEPRPWRYSGGLV